MNGPSVLIVGCGYLGRRVANLLKSRGDRVFGTTRGARADALGAEGIEPVVVDVLDRESLAVLPPTDRIVHAVGFDRKAGRAMRQVYVEGLRNVLDHLSASAWPEAMVYVSSTSVYGQSDGGWIDEESPTEPVSESGRIVLDAERLFRSTAELYPETRGVVLRLAGIYGPGRLPRRADILDGRPIPGDPDAWLNLIHVDDAAMAVIAALDSARPGTVYHVVDDRPLRRREFFGAMARGLGLAEPRFETGMEREATNKRVSNARLRTDLDLKWNCPDAVAGIGAVLAVESGRPD